MAGLFNADTQLEALLERQRQQNVAQQQQFGQLFGAAAGNRRQAAVNTIGAQIGASFGQGLAGGLFGESDEVKKARQGVTEEEAVQQQLGKVDWDDPVQIQKAAQLLMPFAPETSIKMSQGALKLAASKKEEAQKQAATNSYVNAIEKQYPLEAKVLLAGGDINDVQKRIAAQNVDPNSMTASQRADLYSKFTPESIDQHLVNPSAPLVPIDGKGNWEVVPYTSGTDVNGNPIQGVMAVNKDLLPEGTPNVVLSQIASIPSPAEQQEVIKDIETKKEKGQAVSLGELPYPTAFSGMGTKAAIEQRANFLNGVSKVNRFITDVFDPQFSEVVGIGSGGIIKNKLARVLETPKLSTLAASTTQAAIETGLEEARQLAPVTDNDFKKLLDKAPKSTDGVEVWRGYLEDTLIPTLINSSRAAYGDEYTDTYLRPALEAELKRSKARLKGESNNTVIKYEDL